MLFYLSTIFGKILCAISGTVVFEESPFQRKLSTGHFLIRKMFLEYTENIPDDEVKQAGFVGIEHLYRRNKLKVLHFRKKTKLEEMGGSLKVRHL